MAQHLIDPVVEKLQQDLPAYLATRRWYRAKARTISALTIQDIVHADGFLILVAEVQYAGGGSDLYLLPVTAISGAHADEFPEQPITTLESPEGEEIKVYDAVLSPFFRTILLRALTQGAEFQGREGTLVAPASPQAVPIEGTVESFVSRAEQSNTSIIYGRDYILKLFRKIEAGINPDIEVGAFLTEHGFKNTPAVVGTLEYRTHDGESFSAGILQAFVPNQGDAWKFTLESLSSEDFHKSAALLGVRTAEMHATLAADTSDPAFTPEPFTSEDARLLSEEIGAQARRSFQLLREKAEKLPEAEKQVAHQVLSFESKITEDIKRLKSIATDAKRIRFHGDYHLGQVLATGTDFMIIDFEGEPARPLSERRSKGLALRDVAGMLRSFQYAAYTGKASPGWGSKISKVYLDAYFETAAAYSFLPSSQEQRAQFLDAFLLQKALYEVQYELNNRPDWLGIPLRGILDLVSA